MDRGGGGCQAYCNWIGLWAAVYRFVCNLKGAHLNGTFQGVVADDVYGRQSSVLRRYPEATRDGDFQVDFIAEDGAEGSGVAFTECR